MARRRIQLNFVGRGTHKFFIAAKLEAPTEDEEMLELSRLNLRGWVVPAGIDVVSIVVRGREGEVRSELNVDRDDVGAAFDTDFSVPRFGFDLVYNLARDERILSVSVATASDEWSWVEISLVKVASEKSPARPKGIKKQGRSSGARAQSSKRVGGG